MKNRGLWPETRMRLLDSLMEQARKALEPHIADVQQRDACALAVAQAPLADLSGLVYVPKDTGLRIYERNKRLLSRFDGRNVLELSAEFGMTESGVRRAISRARKASAQRSTSAARSATPKPPEDTADPLHDFCDHAHGELRKAGLEEQAAKVCVAELASFMQTKWAAARMLSQARSLLRHKNASKVHETFRKAATTGQRSEFITCAVQDMSRALSRWRLADGTAAEIAAALGAHLASAWGGAYLNFPEQFISVLEAQDAQAHAMYDGHNLPDLAQRFNVSEATALGMVARAGIRQSAAMQEACAI